jgi:2-iminobutanoate/2-iminopropanoate deaminase
MEGHEMKVIATDKAPAAVGPYSQAIAVGNLLFVSGQLPINPTTGQMPDDMLDQMRQCLENVEAIAIAAGSTLAKTVKTTVLVTDLSRFGEFNEVYGKAFAAPFPARACYEVSALPRGAKVEIEAVIALD